MTIGTRETTVGLSGPEPAVLLEFNSLRNSSRYPQRCSVTAQSGHMLMSASATDIRNIAFTDLHPDYPSKRFGGSVCRSESQWASPAITSTVFPDDQPRHAPHEASESGIFDSRSLPRQNGNRLSRFASTSSFSSEGGTPCSCCPRKKRSHRNLGPREDTYHPTEAKETLSNGTSEEVL
ncbi:uncharacterized protein [Macrobrachium rosenbergii]|uniref:uncharacterized protein isoform X2 n=1 Tax=Macrobrachium rosenbergii TaxID=79674 RepID=UPI0034D62D69